MHSQQIGQWIARKTVLVVVRQHRRTFGSVTVVSTCLFVASFELIAQLSNNVIEATRQVRRCMIVYGGYGAVHLILRKHDVRPSGIIWRSPAWQGRPIDHVQCHDGPDTVSTNRPSRSPGGRGVGGSPASSHSNVRCHSLVSVIVYQ